MCKKETACHIGERVKQCLLSCKYFKSNLPQNKKIMPNPTITVLLSFFSGTAFKVFTYPSSKWQEFRWTHWYGFNLKPTQNILRHDTHKSVRVIGLPGNETRWFVFCQHVNNLFSWISCQCDAKWCHANLLSDDTPICITMTFVIIKKGYNFSVKQKRRVC